MSRDEYHKLRGIDFLEHRETISAGHPYIEENDTHRVLFQEAKGHISIGGHRHGVARGSEDSRRCGPHCVVIVDHQYVDA
jgi:hypothetical protein